jgi:acyl-CoA thioesterase-1
MIMQTTIKNISVWGDSMLKGVIYDEQKKRHVQITDHTMQLVAEELQLSVTNYSIFGATVTKGQRQLLKALKKNQENRTVIDVGILEFGGNDCDFNWPKVSADPTFDHQPKTALPVFRQIYSEMIELLLKENITPLLIHPQPVYSPSYFDWITKDLNAENILLWLGDQERIYRQQERYATTVLDLAREYNCRIVPIRQAYLEYKDYYKFFCSDGIHPNQQGHRLMAQTFIRYARTTNLI